MPTFLIFILTFLVLAPFSKATSSKKVQTQSEVANVPLDPPLQTSLYLNWKAEPEFGGFYAGLLENHYLNQGIKIDIKEGGSGTPTIQMLTSGAAEFAIVSAEELILAHDRKSKNKPVALFSVYQKSPYVLIAHKGQFKDLKDAFLNSEILSVQAGLPYVKFLEKTYGPRKKKTVPYQGSVAFLAKNKNLAQQGFITIEPLVAEKNSIPTDSFLISDSGFDPYLVILATSEKTLKEKPELVKKMIAASQKGWESYLKNSTATNRHMVTLNTGFTLDLFEKGAQIQKNLINEYSKVSELGKISEEKLAVLLGQMKEIGLIKGQIPIKSLYYNP